MKRVGFILRPDRRPPGDIFGELVDWVVRNGRTPVVIEEDGLRPDGAEVVAEEDLGGAIDIAIVLGGDGTMLRASYLLLDSDVPALGINFGRLGFLSPFDEEAAITALTDALAGDLHIEERMRIKVRHAPANGPAVVRTGLNEAVIHQGVPARLISLEARLAGELITNYRADGLIVASPTGSTAYNLAAGGPIIAPGLRVIAITPICAHQLTSRPLVVSQDHVISISAPDQLDSDDVVLTVDGNWVHTFGPGDRVDVKAADRPFRLFASKTPYFDILRQKLHWGVGYS